ncbi:MAG: glycosyltransferase family 1 protein, partial [Desulfurobacteriaceae bacterium]
IKSYLRDGINGIAVTPGDVESLFRGIVRGIENLSNEKMKKEARKTTERFDINRVAKETINFYKELLR